MPTMIRGFRRLPPADRLALVYAVSYGAWLLVRTPGTPTTITIGTLAFFPLGLSVAWANWRNATVTGLDRRTRAAWTLLGLAALGLWFSGNSWAFLYATPPDAAEPKWTEMVELLQNLVALSAFLVFPVRWPARGRQLRFFFDVGLTTVAGFVLAFQFGARSTLTEQGAFHLDFVFLSWAVDWALFVMAAIGFLHKRDSTTRIVMGLLLGSSLAYLFANYVLSFSPHYNTGDPVDGLWFLAWVFRWAAARVAAHRYRTAPAEASTETDAETRAFQNSAFSFAMVAGVFLLLTAHVLWGDRQFLGLLTIATLSMAGLLVVRQVVDLRENRRLFESQVAQDARFRLLIQGSSDVVLTIDSRGTITYVSPSAERLYGPTCAIAVGTAAGALVPPEDREMFRRLVGTGQATRRPVQTRVEVAPGTWREVEAVWSDLRNDPVLQGIVVNCRDVTERNELERHLRHAQRLDEVGLLAGGLAHDFNNVLMAIRGYSELIRADLGDPERARDDLAHVVEAVDRAATVTRKLLALSRNQPIQRKPTDLNRVVRELSPLFRQLVTDRIEVTLDLQDGIWPVMADQGQVEQVLLNLATNARDAMPSGGRLRVATANRTLTAETSSIGDLPVGDYAAVIVSDEGCGMGPDVQARIFEPFFSTKGRERGMGLGLAMVMRIVVESGGGIHVASQPGRGSTFTVLLPRTAAVPERSTASTSAPAHTPAPMVPASDRPDSDPRTILLVDDEVPVRAIARRLLQREGYVVLEAETGEQALELATDASQPVDLLLTDLVMPGLHGSQLIARFMQLRPGTPIVCMTGFAGDTQIPGAGWSVLAKPFSSEQLLRTVASALSSVTRVIL